MHESTPDDTVDDVRAKKVCEAIQTWKNDLIDFSGRNRLLYYRDLRVGTLDLDRAAEPALNALLAGNSVLLSRLFPDSAVQADACRRARAIRNKARELEEERGIDSCFLGFGLATWDNPTPGGTLPAAPVVLRQATVRARGTTLEDFELALVGEPEINPILIQSLSRDFGLSLDPDDLSDLADHRISSERPEIFERLEQEARNRVKGFVIRRRVVLGTFQYAKLPMVADLENSEAALVAHDLVAAIAGDRAAQESVRGQAGAAGGDLRTPDHVPPSDEFLILDADSSQNYAINAVLTGRNIVIQGPPGTGKSQTIANLIASLVARRARVLFVAEKRAAISAVTDRLTRCGLGDLVMDVHGGTTARNRIAAELKSAMDAAARTALPDQTRLHRLVTERRAQLNDHVAALHAPRQPWGVTVFDTQANLIGLWNRFGETILSAFRLTGTALTAIDQETARQLREEIREYVMLGGLTLTPEVSPWAGAAVHTPQDAEHAYQLVGKLSQATLPETRDLLQQVIGETGLTPAESLSGWRKVLALLDGVAGTLRTFQPEIFTSPLPQLIAANESWRWRRQNREHPGATAGWWHRRKLRKTTRALCRDGKAQDRKELLAALRAAQRQLKTWKRRSSDGQSPRLPSGLAETLSRYQELSQELRALGAYLQSQKFDSYSPEELKDRTLRLASDGETLGKLPHLNALARRFRGLGLDPLIQAMRDQRATADAAVAMFDFCWHMSILDHVRLHDQRIGAFNPDLHSRRVIEYRSGDTEHITSATARVRRAVAEHIVRTREAFPQESRLVERQANLKRRHLPTRRLFAQAPNLLTALKPCWAMSPLVVSQLLPADRRYFDVVIFDEASQVTPADAVPAILRGNQVVVTGDKHQLPPTAFFTSADEDSEDEKALESEDEPENSLTKGYESILNVLDSLLPSYTLTWHYRSQDERLIGFSNAHIYDRSLVTFPGVSGQGCLTHELVEQQSGLDQQQSVDAEVQRVVELMLRHATERPDESLGVIAMSIKHADRIDTAFRRALRDRPDLHSFFDEGVAQPYFIKNLERVQGDERDAIILSVGYGKNSSGRLLYRFGPLLRDGGERRLNVAVTRARRRMVLVSSFSSADMDPNRSAREGVRLLREYLRYAESGGTDLGRAAARPALNPFEIDVRDRLTAAGIPLTAQYGVAGYHIDFAASHPERPGEMVLAIEADGASYHSSYTARDRDRLRQDHLERLGWTFHRIWSTDWFRDPDRCVTAAVAAYQAAVKAADAKRNQPTRDTPPSAELPTDPRPSQQPSGTARPTRSLPRPPLIPHQPITAYSHRELIWLIRWIESDTLLRTEDEILAEVMRELGFKRRGPRIREAVAAALRQARNLR